MPFNNVLRVVFLQLGEIQHVVFAPRSHNGACLGHEFALFYIGSVGDSVVFFPLPKHSVLARAFFDQVCMGVYYTRQSRNPKLQPATDGPLDALFPFFRVVSVHQCINPLHEIVGLGFPVVRFFLQRGGTGLLRRGRWETIENFGKHLFPWQLQLDLLRDRRSRLLLHFQLFEFQRRRREHEDHLWWCCYLVSHFCSFLWSVPFGLSFFLLLLENSFRFAVRRQQFKLVVHRSRRKKQRREKQYF